MRRNRTMNAEASLVQHNSEEDGRVILPRQKLGHSYDKNFSTKNTVT